MTDIENSFEFEGLLCFARHLESRHFHFVPLEADLDRDPRGNPLVSLTAVGALAYVMLTGVWRATAEALEALRKEIARRFEISPTESIKLSLAPVRVGACHLLLGNGAGDFTVIASSSTSGVPPFSALFNVVLSEEQFAGVAAALNGRPDYLAIEYEVAITTPVSAGARLIPLSGTFLPWLRQFSDAGPAALRGAIEEAVADGRVEVRLDLPAEPSGSLVSRLYERLLDRAAELLPRFLDDYCEGVGETFEISVTVVEEAGHAIRPRVDLSKVDLTPELFRSVRERSPAGQRMAELVSEMSRPLRVGLAFSPEDTPLAWVRVRSGTSEAVLKAPRFEAVEIPAPPGSLGLRVTAGYSDGSPLQRWELAPPPPGDLLLRADQLGLTKLTVDARPLSRAGARQAQIWLRYRPPHRSDEQHHTVRFGREVWTSHWWLVTPATSSLRALTYRWSAETGDGRVVNDAAEHNGSPVITLSFVRGETDVTDR